MLDALNGAFHDGFGYLAISYCLAAIAAEMGTFGGAWAKTVPSMNAIAIARHASSRT